MKTARPDTGIEEMRKARVGIRWLIVFSVMISVFVNLLMLTGPLYMLQVYDRVLGSRSEATLIALTVLVIFLYLCMGLLDYVRARLTARYGARFNARLSKRVFQASLARSAQHPNDRLAQSAQRDLETLHRFWASPLALAMMDLPWTPLFLGLLFIFHPALGWFAVVGGAVLICVALLNQKLSQAPTLKSRQSTVDAEKTADRIKYDAEHIQALGMREAVFARWSKKQGLALEADMRSADLSGTFLASTKTLRMFLQSAILGLGAWLVLKGEISAGVMIAGSILMGRALAPIEQIIGQWAMFVRAREGRENLERLLTEQAPEPERTALPVPRATLSAKGISVVLPGQTHPLLNAISFDIGPGDVLGIIGPSGAGKSTLSRVIIGALRPAAGTLRLDGALIDQYEPDVFGTYIGYLPQNVTLFDGSVAENIARLSPHMDAQKVVGAAKAADAHEMILSLPQGYDTPLKGMVTQLSGGQLQRIALARALYGDPVLLVLDEPNSNLDNDGSEALNAAIKRFKEEKRAVIIIAHRPAAIRECNLLMVLSEGRMRSFGPRDEVMRRMVQNSKTLEQSAAKGGMS